MSQWMTSGSKRLKERQNHTFAQRAQRRAKIVAPEQMRVSSSAVVVASLSTNVYNDETKRQMKRPPSNENYNYEIISGEQAKAKFSRSNPIRRRGKVVTARTRCSEYQIEESKRYPQQQQHQQNQQQQKQRQQRACSDSKHNSMYPRLNDVSSSKWRIRHPKDIGMMHFTTMPRDVSFVDQTYHVPQQKKTFQEKLPSHKHRKRENYQYHRQEENSKQNTQDFFEGPPSLVAFCTTESTMIGKKSLPSLFDDTTSFASSNSALPGVEYHHSMIYHGDRYQQQVVVPVDKEFQNQGRRYNYNDSDNTHYFEPWKSNVDIKSAILDRPLVEQSTISQKQQQDLTNDDICANLEDSSKQTQLHQHPDFSTSGIGRFRKQQQGASNLRLFNNGVEVNQDGDSIFG